MRRITLLVLSLLALALLTPTQGVRAQSCGTAPAPRLTVGQSAFVTFTDGRPINVRNQPDRSGALVAQLPEGTEFQVLDGPACAGDINWWNIQAGEVSGWIAEGLEGQYFVAPAGTAVEIDTTALVDAIPDGDCGPLPSRVDPDGMSYLETVPGVVLIVRSYSGEETFRLETNLWASVYGEPICRSGSLWWTVEGLSYTGEVPETIDGRYVMQPFAFDRPAPPAIGVPMTAPVISTPVLPLPTSAPDERVVAGTFSDWVWDGASDPTRLVLPEAYAGDLPALPVNLDTVHFAAELGLNDAQLALLSQNGFVVVPGGYTNFDEVYSSWSEEWSQFEGKADFITTDALLHTLYLVYENALKFLELEQFYGYATGWIVQSYKAAEAQYVAAIGTPLEEPARRAAVYYGVALKLIEPSFDSYTGNILPDTSPFGVLSEAPAQITADVETIAALASAAEGVLDLPLLDNYQEDFTQYKPRGYYSGSPVLSDYFRAMMWAGRITFRTKSDADTLTGLFALKALRDGGGLEQWRAMDETLAWLVGPVDDLSPAELLPISEQVFGSDLSAAAFGDSALLAAYIEALKALPGPQVNSLPLPVGIKEEELDEFTRGFRTFGQRFTFDAYIFQSLIYPAVGERNHSRALPMGEDVAAVLGSDLAFVETDKAGATTYLNYTDNVARLRTEVNGISAEAWSENLYGAWLHALQPLGVRNPALLPPLMQTDAWKYKDLNSLLGSLTELKHATLLYAEQAYGGLGGGGYAPPVTSYSMVEPNPLVFARIAVIAKQLSDGLQQRGFAENSPGSIYVVLSGGWQLASISADLAEIARKEVAGEPITDDEYYMLQENFGSALYAIRVIIESAFPNPPERMALVADVASNPTAEKIYYMATGDADLIYVVANGPFGLQVTRGGVYSTYMFEGDYQERLDDDQWRARVASGDLPARPAWAGVYRFE